VSAPVVTSPGAEAASSRASFRARRTALIDAFRARADVRALSRGLVRLADEVLRQLWREAGLGETCCLAAVGGFGRGELMPHSDVDLLLLVPEAADEAQAERIERFVGACWDAGLEIGHSVRTVAQCLSESAQDVTVQTSLLERRFLGGRRTLYRRLEQALVPVTDARAFYRGKLFELKQRHAKYEYTPYSLEPNVKESPGGLRDLQSILWIARTAGLGADWSKLARAGHPAGGDAARRLRTQAENDAGMAPHPGGPARRPAGVRSAGSGGGRPGLRRFGRAAGERAADAAVLLDREVGDPDVDDAAAEPRGRAVSRERRAARTDRRRVPQRARAARCGR
jgi:hypothetical protein